MPVPLCSVSIFEDPAAPDAKPLAKEILRAAGLLKK
jgi:hypothetical protein